MPEEPFGYEEYIRDLKRKMAVTIAKQNPNLNQRIK
jgi:hypothetical protein